MKNLHLYHSNIVNSSRIVKETQSLVKLGLADEVVVYGYWKPGLKTVETLDENVKIQRIKLPLTEFNIKPRFIELAVKIYTTKVFG